MFADQRGRVPTRSGMGGDRERGWVAVLCMHDIKKNENDNATTKKMV